MKVREKGQSSIPPKASSEANLRTGVLLTDMGEIQEDKRCGNVKGNSVSYKFEESLRHQQSNCIHE